MLRVSPEADQSSNYFASFSKKGGKSCQVAEYSRREGQWTASIVIERLRAAFDAKQRAVDNASQRIRSSWHLVISHEDYYPGVSEDGYVAEVNEKTGIPVFLDPDRPKRFGDKALREDRKPAHSTPPYSDYVQLCSKGSNFGSTSDKEFIFDYRWQQAYTDGSELLHAKASRLRTACLSTSLSPRKILPDGRSARPSVM
jgi:hypothetical protein